MGASAKRRRAAGVTIEEFVTRGLSARHEALTSALDLLVVDPMGASVRRTRIAARRTRAFCFVAAPVLRRSTQRELNSLARSFQRQLRDARDADMYYARVNTGFGPGARDVHRGLVRVYAIRREETRRQLAADLDSGAGRELSALLGTLATDVPIRRKVNAGAPVYPYLAKRVHQRLEQAHAAVSDLGSPPTDEELHDVRLDIKRARDSAQLASPVLGKRAEKLWRRLRGAQRVLGEHQDATTMASDIEQLIDADMLGARDAYLAGLFAATELIRGRQARAAWPDAWRDAEAAARRFTRATRGA